MKFKGCKMPEFEVEEAEMIYRSVQDNKKMRKAGHNHFVLFINKIIWIPFACLGFLILGGLQNTQFATPAIRLLGVVFKCCSVFHCSDIAQNSVKHRQIHDVLPINQRKPYSPNISL